MVWERLSPLLAEVEKPVRYIGNELNITVKPETDIDLRFALAFPDVYEIGTSYMGFQILYDIINKLDGVQAERVFAPWVDMEELMRLQGVPLYGLETKTPLEQFDIVGFTLQYELGYTNVLNMLDLAGLTPLAQHRTGPLVLAGGPGAANPEPLADFIDAFVIGEGEEIVGEIIQVVRVQRGSSREQLLEQLAKIPGIYVPSLFRPLYDQGGRFRGTVPVDATVPAVKKRIVRDFAHWPLPDKMIVPLMQPIHDRLSVEICRGCARGCRFCQAGMLYRPVRERPAGELHSQIQKLLKSTGSSELSLSSLSSADYSEIQELMTQSLQSRDVSVSLPSLRVDSYSVKLAQMAKTIRNTGLTLAPEAGSQRLRDVINKNVEDKDIISAARYAFESGWQTIKLYFMLGLPTETREDILAVVDIVHRLEAEYRQIHGHSKRFKVNLGISTFVPKPHTPFQWAPQLDKEEVLVRQNLLRNQLRGKKFKVQTTTWEESNLEAALAKGDRRLGKVIYRAWQKGCQFDAWSEFFAPDLWRQAFNEEGINSDEYTLSATALSQPLPWDHIDIGVTKDFLIDEYKRALAVSTTPDCTFDSCSDCGVCPAYGIQPLQRGCGQ